MLKKTYLLTPGPTPVPEIVSSTFARPLLHHRTPEFEAIFERVRKRLKWLFQTEQEVLSLACTGTGAMEAAIANLFNPGDTVLVLNAGKFGERWIKIATRYGLHVRALEAKQPGDGFDLAKVEKAIQATPEAKGILFQASETSTGVKLPVLEICAIAQKSGLLSVCDAITGLGVFELSMDAFGVDCLITGSQKSLMLPPGLAFIALSDRGWAAQAESKLPKFYFDLAQERKTQTGNQTAWTPAISLIQGLDVVLEMMETEGLEDIFKRHAVLAEATRAAVQAMGLELLSKSPSESVTAVKVPSTIVDGKKIPKLLRSKYGVTITGGQDELEGKIFRLSHFGYCGAFDVTTGISALELVLNELGHPVAFGTGVGAALQVIQKGGIFE